MIYLIIKGRIGNQLFMYAAARAYSLEQKLSQRIIIDDSENMGMNYENSLIDYQLDNVEFVHDRKTLKKLRFLPQRICMLFCDLSERTLNERQRRNFEEKYQRLFHSCGLILCENGYLPFPKKGKRNVVMLGYFQSEAYFKRYRNQIIRDLDLSHDKRLLHYPNIKTIRERNTVCISIKVEHNVGSDLYGVCKKSYWEEAIQYIVNHVENPLFFICSDNVDYVKDNLIDFGKYEAVVQDQNSPVSISLAVMSECKHFIIGNTSFGWWAQYLSRYEDKIVTAPSKWYLQDVPCNIYQDNWIIIEV